MADVAGGKIVWKLDVDESNFQRQLARAGASANALGKSVAASGKVASAGIQSGLANSLSSISSFTGQASDAFSNVAAGMSSFISRFRVVGIAAGAATAALVGFGLKSASQLQTTAASMQALTGNTQTAQRLFKELYDFARGTPFAFPDVARAAQTLLGYGRSAKQVTGDIKVLGGLVATTGADWQNLAVVFGQVNASGRLMGQDALQLINNSVPITSALAKQLGIDISKVKEEMEAGNISADEFNVALKSLVPPDAIARLSKTMPGALSNLTGSLRAFAFSILGIDYSKFTEGEPLLEKQGGLFQQVRLGVLALSKELSSVETKQAMAKLGEQIGQVAKVAIPALISGLKFVVQNIDTIIQLAGSFAAAWAFSKVTAGLLKVVSTITGIASALKAARGPAAAFSLALSANPIGLIAAAITALVGALVFLELKTQVLSKTFGPIFQEIWNIVGPILQALWQFIQYVANVIWTMLKPAFEQLWEAIQPILPVLKWVAIIFGVVLVAAIVAFVAVIAVVAVVVAAIVAVVVTVVSAFVKFWVAAFNRIKSGAINVWNAVKSVTMSVVNAVVNFVRGAINRIISIWNGIKRIVGVVASAIGNVVSAIRSGVSRAVSAVTGFIGRFLSAGRDIVMGVVRGIKNAGRAILDAIGGAVEAAINWVKKKLGIASPSKLFADYGKNMMQGMALGISQNAGMVQRSLAGINTDVASPGLGFSGDLGSDVEVSRAGASQPQSVIRIEKVEVSGIYARSQADKREVARDLIGSLNDELRAVGAEQIGAGRLQGGLNGA